MSDTYLRGHLSMDADGGILMGPNAFGEILVTRQCMCPDRFGSVELWTSTAADRAAAMARDARSLTEHRLQRLARGMR